MPLKINYNFDKRSFLKLISNSIKYNNSIGDFLWKKGETSNILIQ